MSNGPTYNLAAIVGAGYGVGREIGNDFSRNRLSRKDKKLREEIATLQNEDGSLRFGNMDDPEVAAAAANYYRENFSGSPEAQGANRRNVAIGQTRTRDSLSEDGYSYTGGTPAVGSYTDGYTAERAKAIDIARAKLTASGDHVKASEMARSWAAGMGNNADTAQHSKAAMEAAALKAATNVDGTVDEGKLRRALAVGAAGSGDPTAALQAGGDLVTFNKKMASISANNAMQSLSSYLEAMDSGDKDVAINNLDNAIGHLNAAAGYVKELAGRSFQLSTDGTTISMLQNGREVQRFPVTEETITELSHLVDDPATGIATMQALEAKRASDRINQAAEDRKAMLAAATEFAAKEFGAIGKAGGVAVANGLNNMSAAGIKTLGAIQPDIENGGNMQQLLVDGGNIITMHFPGEETEANKNAKASDAKPPHKSVWYSNADGEEVSPKSFGGGGSTDAYANAAMSLGVAQDRTAAFFTAVHKIYGVKEPEPEQDERSFTERRGRHAPVRKYGQEAETAPAAPATTTPATQAVSRAATAPLYDPNYPHTKPPVPRGDDPNRPFGSHQDAPQVQSAAPTAPAAPATRAIDPKKVTQGSKGKASSDMNNLLEKTSDLRELIGIYDGKDGLYDVINGGKQVPKLLSMTVREVVAWQRRNGGKAAGKYQFIPDTLEELAKKTGNLNSVFNPDTQDQLAVLKMKERGLESYLNGTMDKAQFMQQLSQEWAALPDSSGVGHYDNDEYGNKANRAALRPVSDALVGMVQPATGLPVAGALGSRAAPR